MFAVDKHSAHRSKSYSAQKNNFDTIGHRHDGFFTTDKRKGKQERFLKLDFSDLKTQYYKKVMIVI
jgi:hypothetical protein